MAAFAAFTFDNATRPISCEPFVLKDGAWLAFEPSDRALAAVRTLTVKQRRWDYLQQAGRIEPRFAEIDRYVAPFEVLLHDGEMRSWTSWAQDARSVLPKTDALVMVNAAGEVLPRLWKDVEQVCGPLPLEDTAYPPRFSGLRWPDNDAWRRLRELDGPSWLPASAADGMIYTSV
jgi:hypothetical protein